MIRNDSDGRSRPTWRPATTDLLWTTYVIAWCVGLLAAPSAPASDAADHIIAEHYTAHGFAVAVQALLVHAVAGVCLAALAVLIWRAGATRQRRAAVAALAAGSGAAFVSIAQAVIAVIAVSGAPGATTRSLASAFHLVNGADVVKLALVAVFVSATTRVCDRRLLRTLGVPLAVLLPIGAAGFVYPAPALQGALVVSLPLLLAWFAAAARAATGPRTHRRPDFQQTVAAGPRPQSDVQWEWQGLLGHR